SSWTDRRAIPSRAVVSDVCELIDRDRPQSKCWGEPRQFLGLSLRPTSSHPEIAYDSRRAAADRSCDVGSPSPTGSIAAAKPSVRRLRPNSHILAGRDAALLSRPLRTGRKPDRFVALLLQRCFPGDACHSWRRLPAPDNADGLELSGH